MLAAAEVAMDASAKDESEAARNRKRLYAPPKGERRAPAAGAVMTRDKAQALMAQIAAEDAQLSRGRRS